MKDKIWKHGVIMYILWSINYNQHRHPCFPARVVYLHTGVVGRTNQR